ncbi:hypothetical protein [Pseudomonas simiae]|jgi:hypothetical protein|uniref:hypothetical protein n=1 Tax=Pseudomonas simiae TaxID=321846 RepID=UPI0020961778|nr:hypothetical protein [Pseudomonas simiae]
MSESPKFDLSTSEGGRGYIAHLFKTALKRHDFTAYITERLAADFACALARHFEGIKAREAALQQRLTAADERADVLEKLLLQTNELLYAIQGDPGSVPSSAIDAMRGEVFTALNPAEGSNLSTCTWSEGGFSWHTGCGKEWQFTDGGLPAENGMHFCHSCGKKLVVESAESA